MYNEVRLSVCPYLYIDLYNDATDPGAVFLIEKVFKKKVFMYNSSIVIYNVNNRETLIICEVPKYKQIIFFYDFIANAGALNPTR